MQAVPSDEVLIEPISYSNFFREPFHSQKDCAVLKADGTWDPTADCFFQQFCTVCEFIHSPPLLLKGLCFLGMPDWVYYLRVENGSGEIFYDGYKISKIEVSNKAWILSKRPGFDRDMSEVSLPLSSPRQYPIGRH